MRIQGKIRKWSDPNKGFGWATGDDGGRDHFVHIRNVVGYEFDDIPVGSSIEFEPVPSARHPGKIEAREVRVLKEAI